MQNGVLYNFINWVENDGIGKEYYSEEKEAIEAIFKYIESLETKILDLTTTYCEKECGNTSNCSEEQCILYNIEQVVEGGKNEQYK